MNLDERTIEIYVHIRGPKFGVHPLPGSYIRCTANYASGRGGMCGVGLAGCPAQALSGLLVNIELNRSGDPENHRPITANLYDFQAPDIEVESLLRIFARSEGAELSVNYMPDPRHSLKGLFERYSDPKPAKGLIGQS